MTAARPAIAVIGAHYGDEGKGLVVDRMVRDLADPWVVRFNGGAQAGHTVTLADGWRHVFSHFGAGTFAGAPTFLSRFFVANPYLFLREAEELKAAGVAPRVVLDPRSPLTTPYEVLVNRAVEEARGVRRHGSCGVGFGETLEREENGPSITASLLDDVDTLRARLDLLRTNHVPRRLASLGVAIDAETRADLHDPSVTEQFIETARTFRRRIELAGAEVCTGRPVVFEGAQGLLLDQTLGAFPYVTRSHTGLPNVVALASELGFDEVEVFYTLRSYVTRHGAGPLPHELPAPPYDGIVDLTNRPNPFQGTLRFALSDPAASADVIARDLMRVAGSGVSITPSLAVTCLDQLDGPVRCVGGDLDPDAFVAAIAGPTGPRRILLSHGPTAGTADFAASRVPYRLFRASAAPSANARSLP
jgi:adenylosuccinate synthase